LNPFGTVYGANVCVNLARKPSALGPDHNPRMGSIISSEPSAKSELEDAIAAAIHRFEEKASQLVIGIAVKRYSDSALGVIDAFTVAAPPSRRLPKSAA
jgi:hypothetical protein